MSWNGPNGGKEQDPWSGGSRPPAPPDLDEVLRRLQKKLAQLFGKRPTLKTVDREPQTPSFSGMISGPWIKLILGAVLLIYLFSGIYIVEPYARAAVFQFGRFIYTVGPGPHWLPRGIRSKVIVNVDQVMTSRHSNRMLTKDENIVSVEVAVQYKVNNLEDYLFNVVDPTHSLQEATDSAIRQVIGESRLDDILTEKRAFIRDEIRQQLENMLALYKPGLVITDVAMQPAKAPDEVKDAFDDAIKAQEDEQRLVNKAQAYTEQVTRFAEGRAERELAEARAYAESVNLRAVADIDRFNRLLPEYRAAPEVMRERLYLEMVEQVLSQGHKIIASDKGQNVLYLPLDQLKQQRKSAESNIEALIPATSNATLQPQTSSSSSSMSGPDYSRDRRLTR